MKRRVFLASTLLLGLSTFASCSCGGKTEEVGLDENGRFKSITAAINISVDTLTPTNGNSNPKTGFYYNLYESLFDINDNEELVPDVGKEITIVDDTHWEVKIFKDVKDSDGNPVKASDIVYSINWLKSSGNAVNYDCFKSISAKDDTTVVFEWNKKPGSFSDIEFPLCRSFVFTEKAYKEHKFASDPVATGNYVVDKFVANSSLTLKANDNYWALSSTEEGIENRLALHKATAAKIVYNYIGEASSADIELGLGNVDYCDYIKSSDLDKYKTDTAYTVDTEIGSTYSWLGFNMDPSNVFANNKNLRLAVCYAIDSAAVASVQPGNFTAMKSYGTGYFSDFNTSWETETNYSSVCDVNKAKEYLQASGYANQEIKIMCKSSEEDTTATEKILTQLIAAGINAKMAPVDVTTFQTDTADNKAWDIVLFSGMGGSNLVGSWQLALSNVGSKTTDGKDNGTLCFNTDQVLFDKYNEAKNAQTKNDTTVKAVIDYVYENAYIYPLTYAMTAKVYKSSKIKDIYYREGYATLGATTYVGQELNKNKDYTGWTIPTDGYIDAALAGSYTFTDAALKEGKSPSDYTLALDASGSFRLDCNNAYGEDVYLVGTWVTDAKGVITLSSDGKVQGAMDRLLNSGWVDSDKPEKIMITLDGQKFIPVGYSEDAGDDTPEEPSAVPGIVTALTSQGFDSLKWEGGKAGTWYLIIKADADKDEQGREKGEAHLVVTGLPEITKADKTEFVYHGTFTNDKGQFTFTLGKTDDEVIGQVWNEDKQTAPFGFGENGFAPKNPIVIDTTPGIVTALTGNGFDSLKWEGSETQGTWYLLIKTAEEKDEQGRDCGEAHLVVTGLSEIEAAEKNEFVYHGTFTNDKGTFTFTLGATDDAIIGKVWNEDSTQAVFGFGKNGFTPKVISESKTPGIVTALTGNGFTSFKYSPNTSDTWYLIIKASDEKDEQGREQGEAHLVITGLSEIAAAEKTEFVYHGTFTNDKGVFTFTLSATDDEIIGKYWSADKTTVVFQFGKNGFAPKAEEE